MVACPSWRIRRVLGVHASLIAAFSAANLQLFFAHTASQNRAQKSLRKSLGSKVSDQGFGGMIFRKMLSCASS
jgi:hypothetical protein